MDHLKELNITYIEHLGQACKYSFTSFYASIIFIIHGFFPNIFIYTGSNIIKQMYFNNII